MTGRNTIGLAAVAAVVALAAGVTLPFLHHQTANEGSPVIPSTSTSTDLQYIGQIAEAAARRAVACRPAAPHRPHPSAATRDTCGQFTVTRRETFCPAAIRCQVQLIGGIATTTVTVPVALTVTLRRRPSGWVAAAVTS